MKIKEIYAFISEAEGDGILGFQMGTKLMQAVSSDLRIIEMMKPFVEEITQNTGKVVKLQKFRLVEDE